jgi:hypothetical protein
MTKQPTRSGNTTPAGPMTTEQRAAFDRDGYLIIRGALGPDRSMHLPQGGVLRLHLPVNGHP